MPEARPLRRGWTTGACATAATKAAYAALLTGAFPDPVEITLPRGQRTSFALATTRTATGAATAGIVKDAGDDPDVTHGALVLATVRPGAAGSGVTFRAGPGVGTVTRPGLPIAPGEPAINPVPRRMIRDVIAELAGRHGAAGDVGLSHIAGATGAASEAAVQKLHGLPETALIDMGDFVGGMLKHIRAHPLPRVTVAGGVAKMTKLAQGLLDLHSKRGAVDLAGLAGFAEAAGGSADLRARILASNTAAEAFDHARHDGIALGDAVARAARTVAAQVVAGKPIE